MDDFKWFEDLIECPHCEHKHRPTGSHEEDDGEWECASCEKPFDVLVEYTPTYSVSKPKNWAGDDV